jgi:predicted alpha/beta hydrolase family esterase
MSANAIASYLKEFRVLTVPGLNDSGPGHWQTRWEELHPHFERVRQDDWAAPELDTWSKRLASFLRKSSRPVVIVAHSFGCLTTVHRAGTEAGNIAGALLVAPADPQKFGVAERLHGVRLPVPSIVIGSTNDPWMPGNRAAYWADCWGSEYFNAGPLGHINAESGLGDWRFGQFCLQQLVLAIKARQRVVRRTRPIQFGMAV